MPKNFSLRDASQTYHDTCLLAKLVTQGHLFASYGCRVLCCVISGHRSRPFDGPAQGSELDKTPPRARTSSMRCRAALVAAGHFAAIEGGSVPFIDRRAVAAGQ